MPRPWEVTELLFDRFAQVGVTGMIRNHTPWLAVLLVHTGFVVWSDGITVWWLTDEAIAAHRVSTPEELWRLAYGRYCVVAGRSAGTP